MESRARSTTVADPRTSLALWLRAGRAQRKLTIDDVARVTKIQPRILEKLETGQLEGLPADVFVRGFVKSFARCVGLDEGEAVERYGACAGLAATPATSAARAFVETLVAAPARSPRTASGTPPDPTPVVAAVPVEEIAPPVEEISPAAEPSAPVIEIEAAPVESAPVIESAPAEAAPKKRRSRKKADGTPPRARKKKSAKSNASHGEISEESSIELAASGELATQTASTELATASSEIANAAIEIATSMAGETPTIAEETSAPVEIASSDTASTATVSTESAPTTVASSEAPSTAIEVVDHTAQPVWQPTMPPIATTPTVPWRRPALHTSTYVVPTLVIDDADPELADREREEREAARAPSRVSFLPPILLERDDKSGRQGGLTLAVILLLIAATLTLSYLMRRPGATGDGVTMHRSPVLRFGAPEGRAYAPPDGLAPPAKIA